MMMRSERILFIAEVLLFLPKGFKNNSDSYEWRVQIRVLPYFLNLWYSLNTVYELSIEAFQGILKLKNDWFELREVRNLVIYRKN